MAKNFGPTFLAWCLTLGIALGSPIGLSNYPVKRDYAIFESANVPPVWNQASRAPSSHLLDMKIGLKQKAGHDEIAQHLYEISDPSHARYGQHFTLDEVNELITPLEESIEAVREWLAENGIHPHQYTESPARDWVSFSIPVQHAESLLDTEYSVYKHGETGEHLIRTDRYSLPLELHNHIDLVAPSIYFGAITAQKAILHAQAAVTAPTFTPRSNGNVTGCNPSALTNGCLRALYKTYDYKPATLNQNLLGVTGYYGEHANLADLQNFLITQRPDAAAAGYQFAVQLVNGGTNDQVYTPAELQVGSGEEANLDVQTAGGFLYPDNYTFYSVGGSPPFTPDLQTPTNTNEPYLEFLNYVLAQKTIPSVFSTSYGDDEQTVPLSYALRVCNGFGQLGLRGVSVLFASGDAGVGGPAEVCFTNDGKNASTFLPSFPLSCPFVTGVGATQDFSPEVAVNETHGGFFSGGGFSNYFPIPAYQLADVATYVKSMGTQYKGLYNPLGRAYPDVAAQGAPYLISYAGTFHRIAGTSASTPTFSSVVTLLNDYLISKGKPTLGFLNPWLYSKGRQGLNDILQGFATGCGVQGFSAAKGWDPVTGLGTPDFLKLTQLLGS